MTRKEASLFKVGQIVQIVFSNGTLCRNKLKIIEIRKWSGDDYSIITEHPYNKYGRCSFGFINSLKIISDTNNISIF